MRGLRISQTYAGVHVSNAAIRPWGMFTPQTFTTLKGSKICTFTCRLNNVATDFAVVFFFFFFNWPHFIGGNPCLGYRCRFCVSDASWFFFPFHELEIHDVNVDFPFKLDGMWMSIRFYFELS